MLNHDVFISAPARPWRLLSAYGFYVLAVLWPDPQHRTLISFFLFQPVIPPDMRDMSTYYQLAVLYTVVPALLFFGERCLHPVPSGSSSYTVTQILLCLYLVIAVLDFVMAILLGPICAMTALGTVCWTLVFIWAHRDGEGLRVKAPWFRLLTVLYLLVFTLWSAGSITNASVEAVRKAGGLNFCIATTNDTSDGESYGPIDSLLDLRGTNLYTSATGYKDSSRWYRHAVLIGYRRDGDGGYRKLYWYWSIRLQKFVPYDGESRYWPVSSQDACSPRSYFLFTL